MMRILKALLILPGMAAACSNPFFSDHCADALTVRAIPTDTTLSVGQRFTAALYLSGCRDGSEQLHDTFSWGAEDTTVVRVDPISGVVTAVGSGQTRLVVHGARYGPQGGTSITVR
jgi:hypothetical protein